MKELTPDTTMGLLRMCGALFDGHYVGTQEDPTLPKGRKGGGLHMDKYVDGREVLTYPDIVAELGQGIAFALRNFVFDVVVGIPLGSYTLAHEVAKALNLRYVMAERTPHGTLSIARPAFVKAITGKRVAVVEDTMSQGDTARNAIRSVLDCTDMCNRSVNATVVAVGCVISRGSATSSSLGVPLRSLIHATDMPMLTRQECLERGPCSRRVPINTDLGHGADMLQLIEEGLLPGNPSLTFMID